MANIKELSYVIKTTFGAPLDVRYVLSSITGISSELPRSLRYRGQLVFVEDKDALYIFKNGISDVDLVPFNQTDIVSVDTLDAARSIKITYPGQLIYVASEKMYFTKEDNDIVPQKSSCIRVVQTWDDALNTTIQSRYIGQQIFITDEGRMYIFRNGIYNADLVPSENVAFITSLTNVDVEYPTHCRQYGQYIWVEDLKQLRVVDKNKKLIKVHNDIVTISDDRELTELSKEEARPFIIINKDTQGILIWSDKAGRYIDTRSNTIISGDTVPELLLSLSKKESDMQRVEGQLYFIRNLGEYYTFIGGIADENFISIKSQYVVDTILDVDIAIPSERRYVGQQFYVVDEGKWYYFKDNLTYTKISGFTQTTKQASFYGDYELVHNQNTTSILLNIKNSRGEVVDIPWRQGYLNESGKNQSEIAFGERNVISFSTDVYDTYTINILSA